VISDILLVVGLISLAAAGFLVGLLAGLVVVGLGCIVLALCFADGKGYPWRS
jgi:hypothetical protein